MSTETLPKKIARLSMELSEAAEQLRRETEIMLDPSLCKQPKFRIIRTLVCEHLGLPETVMISRIKNAEYVYARWLAMWLCREITHRSLAEIGEAFGGRDHGTVAYGLSGIIYRRDTEPKVAAEMDALYAAAVLRINGREAA